MTDMVRAVRCTIDLPSQIVSYTVLANNNRRISNFRDFVRKPNNRTFDRKTLINRVWLPIALYGRGK
jgi:hypothetical protein